MKQTLTMAALAAVLGLAQVASAAFIVETRSGGKGFANFAFGPNTTSASNSTATSPAFGVTPAIGSIFGGDAPSGTTTPTPDAYTFKYTPGTDADNLVIPVNTVLNDDGGFGFGMPGGISGTYRVYTTWPNTSNISTGNNPANFALTDGAGTLFTATANQDADSPGGLPGSEWVFLGEVTLTGGTTYTLTQTNTQVVVDDGFGTVSYSNGFVSMRASAAMFQLVPEPASALMALCGLVALGARRRG
ncbi:MAG: hypothetical protein ACRCT8_05975 [Lacipirellulaceae bacterium]